MRRFLIPILGVLLMGAYVSPSKVGGKYQFHVVPAVVQVDAEGIPITSPAVSVGIIDLATSTILSCGEIDSTQTYSEINPMLLEAEVTGPPPNRVTAKAFSFSEPGCSGIASIGSEMTGAIFLGRPGAPGLVQ